MRSVWSERWIIVDVTDNMGINSQEIQTESGDRVNLHAFKESLAKLHNEDIKELV